MGERRTGRGKGVRRGSCRGGQRRTSAALRARLAPSAREERGRQREGRTRTARRFSPALSASWAMRHARLRGGHGSNAAHGSGYGRRAQVLACAAGAR